MPHIKPAAASDEAFLHAHDRHIAVEELSHLVERGRVLIVTTDEGELGWLRWSMFWDSVPFMNMLFVLEQARGHGLGRALVEHWETAMQAQGHTQLMTSTLADEAAQHFYRRLGYVDCGCLLLPGEATEIIFRKEV